MYYWIVFLHVAAVFTFLMAHGVSATVAFQLRRLSVGPLNEQALERLRGQLDLSTNSLGTMYGSLLVLIVSGIIAGFMGNWWGHGWIWVAIGVLILTTILMYARGAFYFAQLRDTLGLPRYPGHPSPKPKSIDEITVLLKSPRPLEVISIGMVGLLVLLGLMILKPF